MNTEQQKTSTNIVLLCGYINSPIVKSHNTFNEQFYDFTLDVRRDSGAIDHLQVTASEYLLRKDIVEGAFVYMRAEFRSYNKIDAQGKSHLMLYIFAKDISATIAVNDGYNNHISLDGTICKPPVYRTTPLGREICDILIAVNRRYGKSNYIPCIVWGRNAKRAETLQVGDKIWLGGRVQSREYTRNEQTCTAYEVSVKSFGKVGE